MYLHERLARIRRAVTFTQSVTRELQNDIICVQFDSTAYTICACQKVYLYFDTHHDSGELCNQALLYGILTQQLYLIDTQQVTSLPLGNPVKQYL